MFDLRSTLPKYLKTNLNKFEALTNLANGPIIFMYYAEKEKFISTLHYTKDKKNSKQFNIQKARHIEKARQLPLCFHIKTSRHFKLCDFS